MRALPFPGLLAVGAVLLGCGGGPPSLPEPPSPLAFASHASAHFTFRYTPLDAATVAATAAAVEAHHARILGDLGLDQAPLVTVTLYPDPESFRNAVVPLVGNVPSFASGLVTGPADIHVLSPNLASRWAYGDGLTAIVHEFAHCASMRVNPSIPNNPRWLWEAVALYEAGQILDPRGLPYMAAHRPPTLAELNRIENTAIYEVGGLIGQFVAETWGRAALRDLVRTGGAVQSVLGVDEAAFASRWFEYARERYGLMTTEVIP
jgi:hypothetical protein